MLTSAPFYHSSIRNLTTSFGSLFNNINILRFAANGSIEKNIKVPLAYASADKTVIMLQQQDAQRREGDIDIKISLPRVSFELTGLAYDSARKQQTTGKTVYVPPSALTFASGDADVVNLSTDTITVVNHKLRLGSSVTYSYAAGGSTIVGLVTGGTYYVIPVTNSSIKLANSKAEAEAGTALNLTALGTGTATLKSGYKSHYNPVPYNFDFSLNIFVKYMDDGLQIIEQILPYFTPFYTLTLNDIADIGVKRDVQVTLTSVSKDDVYEGAVDEDRILTWTLNFTAHSWIYPPITDSKIIKTAVTNFRDLDDEQYLLTVTDQVSPFTANRGDLYTINETIEDYTN